MARITVEDCLQFVMNRYELVHLTARRARQLFRGADRLVYSKNLNVVTALREIAAGKVRFRHMPPPKEESSSLTQ
ncbi:MAG: DNA-directed RNA polymerase subunit omega [Bdellovibrionales bacterium]|nr:DNA-directed RNA polymerase subunit omega [Bdellovibrionales bacterium]